MPSLMLTFILLALLTVTATCLVIHLLRRVLPGWLLDRRSKKNAARGNPAGPNRRLPRRTL